MRTRHTVFLPVLVLVAAACGSGGDDAGSNPPDGEPASSPLGKTFLSTEVAGHELVEGTQIRLQLDADGRVVADAGCNTLGGTGSIDDGVLHVSDLSTTAIGCDAPRHAQDEWLAELLTSSPAVEYADDTLTLTSMLAGTETSVVFVDRRVADPDRPLEGTRWVVDTVISGETASNVPGMENAYLVFAGGQVSGSTGCNQLGGTASVTADTITFLDVFSTQMFCEDTAELEAHVIDVLAGEVRYTIEAGRLTLEMTEGDAGLGLRAQE